MTYNKDTSPPGVVLPIDVRSLFRMVSLVKPDFSLILKAKCAAMGFRAPAVLGARLKALTELARDELWVLEVKHLYFVWILEGKYNENVFFDSFISWFRFYIKFAVFFANYCWFWVESVLYISCGSRIVFPYKENIEFIHMAE